MLNYTHMKINRTVFYSIQAVFFLVAPLTIAGIIYGALYFLGSPESNDTSIRANSERMRASAQVYYSRVRFYSGVCQDIGALEPPFRCNDSDTAYAVSALLDDGKNHCFDSTGFSGDITWSLETRTVCARN